MIVDRSFTRLSGDPGGARPLRAPALVAATIVALAIAAAGPALAQESGGGGGAPDRGASRLFQRFVEDAGIVPGGWLEGQYSYENLSEGTLHRVGPVIAFRLGEDVEAGLRFAYERLSRDRGADGSGISDIDLYGKYRFPGGATRFAVGGLVKTANADEEEGLGTGAADFEAFGALRSEHESVTLVANAGVRFNGSTRAPTLPSRDSLLIGGAVLLPATPAVTFSVEGSYETRRLQGDHADGRLTIGLQTFGRGGNGGFRGAIGIPLTDGAPDLQIIAGAYLVY